MLIVINGIIKSKDMGVVYADIELINGEDAILARRQMIGEDEVRRIGINILVDTGSHHLAINENIQEYLQLPVLSVEKMRLANNQVVECKVVGPVDLRFKDRSAICKAFVLPDDSEPLLGVILLEGMDVLIDTVRQELIVNTGMTNIRI